MKKKEAKKSWEVNNESSLYWEQNIKQRDRLRVKHKTSVKYNKYVKQNIERDLYKDEYEY